MAPDEKRPYHAWLYLDTMTLMGHPSAEADVDFCWRDDLSRLRDSCILALVYPAAGGA